MVQKAKRLDTPERCGKNDMWRNEEAALIALLVYSEPSLRDHLQHDFPKTTVEMRTLTMKS